MKIINFMLDLIFSIYEKYKYLTIIIIYISSFLICLFSKINFHDLITVFLSFSSIILAILSILLTCVLNLKSTSIFFKKAKKFKVDEDILRKLVNIIFCNIYLNLFFMFILFCYNFFSSINLIPIKIVGKSIIFYLFIYIFINTTYVIYLIYQIYNFEEESTTTKFET